MKLIFLPVIFLLSGFVATAQMFTSAVEIATVYSQNEQFYLKSIPYDNESPSMRGKTFVYQKGKPDPLYIIERGFDLFLGNLSLFLSNDGQVIFYVIGNDANEEKEGLKSINVYKTGRLIRSYTETEINGCDKARERCSLVYSNYDEVVDRQKSQAGTAGYQKVFRAGVSEKEKFLSDFAVFSFDDTVYLTDSKKQVHTFDLNDGRRIGSDSFDSLYQQIRTKGRFTKSDDKTLDAPTLDFPNLTDGTSAKLKLANLLGMKVGDPNRIVDSPYKWYSFNVAGTISQDGTIEIESIEVDDELPRDKIVEFFRTNKFDTRLVPKVFEKWHIRDEYFYFRKANDRVAREEGKQQRIKQRQTFEQRLTSERIKGRYIPANLGECMEALDKELREVDKQEIKALPDRSDTIMYHMGLGMWLRNNWGLWSGSRLLKYFRDRGITHPDDMSGIILTHYHDWLNNKRDTWKVWESQPIKE